MQSYGEILKRMTDLYESKTGTTPDRASDIGIRMEVLAGEIFSAYAELNWLKNQMFPETAEGEYLDLHAKQRGLTRKSGTKASGNVEFYLERLLSYNVDIPKGTVVATTGSDPVQFVTTEDAVILSGRLAVAVDVEAVREGADGNAAAKEISVMVTPVLGVDHVVNDYAAENGSDSESDESLRARIIDSFVNISNGTNIAYYRKTAMDVDGVTAAGVIPRNRGVGTVDVFITDSGGNPSAELLESVRSTLRSQREVNVDIEVKALERVPFDVYAYVETKDGWDFFEVRKACVQAVRKYFQMLSAGEPAYLSEVGEYIKHADGVKNYTFETLFMKDMNTTEDKIFCEGDIVIVERRN